jgi:DNA-binding PadR family transcriptional regulator
MTRLRRTPDSDPSSAAERARNRGRVFGQGDLRLVVLRLIGEQPRHGYDLIKGIEGRLGGAYTPSPGVIYPALGRLEKLGLVRRAAPERGKKPYAITDAGRSALETNAAAIDALFARMNAAGAGSAHTLAELPRALQDLKAALRVRLARGRLSEDEARRIVATLNAAAGEIERS